MKKGREQIMRSIVSVARVVCLVVLIGLISCKEDELDKEQDAHVQKYQVCLKFMYELKWRDTSLDYGKDDFPGFDYESLVPKTPKGIRLLAYGADRKYDLYNCRAEGDSLVLRGDVESVLLYNNDTENIVFERLEDPLLAIATTSCQTRSSVGKETKEVIASEPDWLFGGFIDKLQEDLRDGVDSLSITLKPLVYTYAIRFRLLKGSEDVLVSRGFLSGMARSVYLHSGKPTPEPVTIPFECRRLDSELQAVVKSFGISDIQDGKHTESTGVNVLGLNIKLKNGKVKGFRFDITDQLRAQPRGGIITIDGISIDRDDSGEDKNGGFDVDVDDWGDFEDVPLL